MGELAAQAEEQEHVIVGRALDAHDATADISVGTDELAYLFT